MKDSGLPFLRNALAGVRQLKPYEPGMPIEELQRQLGVSNAVKLASNENPLGVSPKVRALLQATTGQSDLARYPDGSGFRLRQKLAALHGVDPSQVTLGNGSNDILEFISRVFLGPGRAAVFSKHAFAVYPLATLAQSAEARVAAPQAGTAEQPYGHDLDAFARLLDDDVSVVFIANPNNPTGTWLAPAAIKKFLQGVAASTIVVLDEAYWHYQDAQTRVDAEALLRQHNNLVVTRTFSKVYGLASLRVGYALSHPDVADLMNRVRQPFNNNSLALAAAECALEDQAFVAASVTHNRKELARLVPVLESKGLRCLPTQANFVAVDFGQDAAPVHQALLRQGVIVRPMGGGYELPQCLRITVGTAAENDRFLAALDTVWPA